MQRFSANLSLLFTELPLIDRFRAAREQGFSAVEIQFPYGLPAEQIQVALRENDLRLVLFNVAASTLLEGGEGLAAVPDKQSEFRAAVTQAADYARQLEPYAINVLPGRCLDLSRLPEYRRTLLANLSYAADIFAPLGVLTLFEAINSHDMPGFIIDSSDKMLMLLEELRHPNVRLQYDIYHMTRMGEDCSAFLAQHWQKIGHIQFADCPGRGQPGSGHIDFQALFSLIAQSGYAGWLGAEYQPQVDTISSLIWLASYQP